jgi:hypothetical protein
VHDLEAVRGAAEKLNYAAVNYMRRGRSGCTYMTMANRCQAFFTAKFADIETLVGNSVVS